MMKFITKTAAFTLTFIFSLVLTGFPKTDLLSFESRGSCRDQYNISAFLQRDVENGRERDYKVNLHSEDSDSYFEVYTENINEYVDKSINLNDQDLPSDFQSAWREHLRVWRDYNDFINERKTTQISSCAFNRLDNIYNQEISETWDEVLRVGREYGVELPD